MLSVLMSDRKRPRVVLEDSGRVWPRPLTRLLRIDRAHIDIRDGRARASFSGKAIALKKRKAPGPDCLMAEHLNVGEAAG